MGLDIKIPIGLMFTLLGLVLAIFGLFTNSDGDLYNISLGININLYAGLFMIAFGAFMLIASVFTKRARKKEAAQSEA